MITVSFEEALCRKRDDTDAKYRLVIPAAQGRKGEVKSVYRLGETSFAWDLPFKDPVTFSDSNSPLRVSIELRKKGWLGLSGQTVCSYILDVDRDCQSATFNLRANESGTPSSPELSVTLTVAGLSPANEDAAQGVQDAPVVTISGPDDAEDIASGSSPRRLNPHVEGRLSTNQSTVSPQSLLRPASRGANDQLLSEALTKSNDAMRSQSSLDLRAPSIAESNTDVAGPAAEATAQISWSGVSRIGAVMELVNVAADIHPLVKGVWSLLNVAYVLAKQQADLDTNVERLVHALDANCELAKDLAENQITGIAETIVGNILKEVLRGASVIKEYCVIRKSKASLFKFVGSPTASQVDACIETLELLRQDLSAHLAAGTQRDLQTLASTMNERFDRIDNYFQTKEEEALLNQMPYAPEADRDLRSRERGCLPQTRVEIIDVIVNWAIGAELDSSTSYIPGLHPDSRVLWLCGVAGSGKSSIAISVAKALLSMDRLGALYGFERAFQTTLNPTSLFSTIARQRADRQPEQKRRLLRALQQMKPEMRASVDAGEQLRSFMAMTLEDASAADDVIVIDAFDESGSVSKRAAALLVLSPETYTTTFPSDVRFVITSRYDSDIAERLDGALRCDPSIISVLQMEDIRAPDTVRDIEIYVIHVLGNVRGLETSRAAGDLARLAVTAEHSFQWASTSCRYIVDAEDHDGARLPAERLQETLDTRGGLDELYLSILNQSFRLSITNTTSDGTRSLRMILGCLVCASEPLTVQTIAALASTDPSFRKVEETSFHILARKLSSIITGTKDTTTPLVAFHTSFTDFLADGKRSEHYAVDASEMHLHLALASLAMMKKLLRLNICHFPSSFLRNDQVTDLAHRVKENISPELLYACRFWPVHAAFALSSVSVDSRNLRESLSEILEDKFLLLEWLEVMSLTGTDAYEFLSPLSSRQTEYRSLSDLITFIAYFAIPISTSVPHIYLSALAFTPSSSSVTSALADFPNLVQSSVPLISWPQVRHTFAHQSEVNCVAFSPNGKWVLSGAESGEISVWDVYSGRLILPRMFGSSRVFSMAISADGSLLASGFRDGNIQLWDMRTMSASGEPLQGHTGKVNSVAFSPDGALLASGSDDETVRLWAVSSRSQVGSPLLGHSGCVMSVSFSPNGELLASGGFDGTVRLWDVQTASAVGEPLRGHDRIWPIVFSPSGLLLAFGEEDGALHLWDVNTMSALEPPLTAHTAFVRSLLFSPDSKLLASCSDDRTIRLWDMTTRSQVGEPLVGHTGDVVSIAFSPDGALLASGSSDKTVHIWDARVLTSNRESPATQFTIRDFVAFSRDGKLLASGSDGNTIQLWDVHSVSPVGEPVKGHTDTIRSVAFSPDGTLLASGSDDSNVRLWDVRTGSAAGEPLRGHSVAVWALAFSLDGKLLASGSNDGTVWLWDTHARSASGDPLTGHSKYVLSIAFSPDGLTLASGDADGAVRLWDVQTRCLIGQVLGAHSDWVQCLVFSPDGMLLASGSDDKTVRIWDVGTRSAVGEPLNGHDKLVSSLAFSSDGTFLASAHASWIEGVVRIWDVRAPSEVGGSVALLRHGSNVVSIAFSPDAPLLSSVTSDGVVRKWDLRFLLSTRTPNILIRAEDGLRSQSLSLLPNYPDLASLSLDCLTELDDGWLVGPQKELVLWIPPAIRPSLSTLLEIERFGGSPLTRLDFTDFVCGSDWAKCYSPLPPSSDS